MAPVFNAGGYKTAYEYDKVGNVVAVTDALNGIARYVYDAEGYAITYTYDELNRLVSYVDADGYVTEYTYSALDMVTHINYNGGKQVITSTTRWATSRRTTPATTMTPCSASTTPRPGCTTLGIDSLLPWTR